MARFIGDPFGEGALERQQALVGQQNLKNIVGGIQGFADIEADKRKRALMERQMEQKENERLQDVAFRERGQELQEQRLMGNQGFRKQQFGLKEQELGLRERGVVAKEKLAGMKAKKEREEAITKQIDDIRKEVGGLPVKKDLDVVAGSYNRVKEAAKRKSAAGDLALIFNFMKVQDPGSVVRESEFRNAARARAEVTRLQGLGIPVPSVAIQALQKLTGGQTLLPEQRQDFVDTAGSAAQGQLDIFRQATQPQRIVAQERGLPPEQIFGQFPVNFIQPQQGVAQAGQIFTPQQTFGMQQPQQMIAQPQQAQQPSVPGVQDAVAADPQRIQARRSRIEELMLKAQGAQAQRPRAQGRGF